MKEYKVVIDKSTVPVGTADKVRREISAELDRRGVAIKAALKTPVIFDGRNLYEPSDVAMLGFEYHAIGRPVPVAGKGNGREQGRPVT